MALATSIQIEIAQDFASYLDANDYRVDLVHMSIRLKQLETDREDARARREAARLPMGTEARTCPACFEDFPVVIHGRPGRLRDYCSDRCQHRAEKRRYREKCASGELASDLLR